MLPTREQAEALLREAAQHNPGQWDDHSRTAAHCAEAIAAACGLDAEKAYIVGLLHDIGRKFGTRHLGHVSDGYSYMMSLGYDEAARICLTHSFSSLRLDDYIGKFDTTPEELELIRNALSGIEMDEYDKLIQLCDALAGAGGVVDIEARMDDIQRRYGSYPPEKRAANFALKEHFEALAGRNIYDIVDKEHYHP